MWQVATTMVAFRLKIELGAHVAHRLSCLCVNDDAPRPNGAAHALQRTVAGGMF